MGSTEYSELKCKCGRPIVDKGKHGLYHKPGTNPPIGHYVEIARVTA